MVFVPPPFLAINKKTKLFLKNDFACKLESIEPNSP